MWRQRLTQSGAAPYASFAILDGERPVSYAISAVHPRDWEDQGYTDGWIEGVGTVRGYRGRGLGSAVITAAMQAFAGKGLEYATLEVDSGNPNGATGLYGTLGFERVGGYVDYTLTVRAGE
jgi:ribosomal protein S18 acetylase RimI-like enzyme